MRRPIVSRVPGRLCRAKLRVCDLESRRTKKCSPSGKTRDLGGQSTSIKTVPLRGRPQIIQRSRLRLFGHSLLCTGGGWFDQHTDELNRVSWLRRTRRRQMDHGLRTRRSHIRSHCGPATRHDAIRSLHRQVGPPLVRGLPATARV